MTKTTARSAVSVILSWKARETKTLLLIRFVQKSLASECSITAVSTLGSKMFPRAEVPSALYSDIAHIATSGSVFLREELIEASSSLLFRVDDTSFRDTYGYPTYLFDLSPKFSSPNSLQEKLME